MKDADLPDEFVSSLLARDAWLGSPEFLTRRRQLIERVARAAQREKRARKLILFASAGTVVVIGILFAIAAPGASAVLLWPDWVRLVLALVFILTPVTLLLLLGIYLFRYRLGLVKARRQARQQTLLALPAQIDQLRREVDELKAQLKQGSSPRMPPVEGNSAFTLLEMLVVVGILGILASLLFPSLARAKSKAGTAACKNNLSQMGKALAMYDADFHYFPGAGEDLVRTNQPPFAFRSPDSWRAKVTPFLSGNTNVFSGPAYQLPAAYSTVTRLPYNYTISYGYNAGGSCKINDSSHHLGLGSGEGDYVSLTAVRAPADMIAVGDLQVPPGLVRSVITPWHKVPVGALKSVIPSRHAGGANMVFADSHVEWAKQQRWVAETSEARTRWNNDHQPHPETW